MIKNISWAYKTFIKKLFYLIPLAYIPALFSATLQLWTPTVSSDLIDALASLNLHLFTNRLILLFLLQISLALLQYLLRFVNFRIDKKFSIYTETKLYSFMLRRNISTSKGVALSAFREDLGVVVNIYRNIIPTFFISLIYIIVISVILIRLDLLLFFCVLFSSLLPLLFTTLFGRKLKDSDKRQREIQDKYNSYIVDSAVVLQDIKMNHGENLFQRRFFSILEKSFKEFFIFLKLNSILNLITSLISTISSIILYVVIGHMIFSLKATIGNMVSTIMYAGILASKISSITNGVESSIVSFASFERLKEFCSSELKMNLIKRTEYSKPKIKIRDLCYSYVDDKNVLKDINISLLSPGIYLVKGENGCGKTTLLNLIAGFLDCTYASGEIEICGEVNYTSDHSALFPMTLKENLAMDRILDLDIAYKYFNYIGLSEYISKLDQNIFIDDEVELSQGQVYKMLILRAILSNSSILLFDEIDKSFDKETKFKLKKIFSALGKNKLILLVSHSDEYDSIADHIIELK